MTICEQLDPSVLFVYNNQEYRHDSSMVMDGERMICLEIKGKFIHYTISESFIWVSCLEHMTLTRVLRMSNMKYNTNDAAIWLCGLYHYVILPVFKCNMRTILTSSKMMLHFFITYVTLFTKPWHITIFRVIYHTLSYCHKCAFSRVYLKSWRITMWYC